MQYVIQFVTRCLEKVAAVMVAHAIPAKTRWSGKSLVIAVPKPSTRMTVVVTNAVPIPR